MERAPLSNVLAPIVRTVSHRREKIHLFSPPLRPCERSPQEMSGYMPWHPLLLYA